MNAGIDTILNARARNARWCAAHRHVQRQNAWLAGAPPYGTHLDGAAMAISVTPPPEWPIELRNTRALHGMLTEISKLPHLPHAPRWALVPWQNGWAVYWFHGDLAEFSRTTHQAVLFDRGVTVQFGPPVYFRTPRVPRRGRQIVRVDAVTPVTMAYEGRNRPVTCPADSHLVHGLDGMLLQQIAPSASWRDYVRERIRLRIRERATIPAHVPLGGKYGMVSGWTGSVVLEVNAVARWLLGVCERRGLGGRIAFGFGRIRVTDLAEAT